MAENSEQIPGESGQTQDNSTGNSSTNDQIASPTDSNNSTQIASNGADNVSRIRPNEAHRESPYSDGNRAISDLMAAINSLPEKITNSLQEALTPPKAQSNPGQTDSVHKQTTETTIATKPRKTFAQWWFGD